jgi:hypothetical protein
MSMTDREVWALLHGMIFGGLFLIAYTGTLVALYSLKTADLTLEGIKRRLMLTKLGTTVMAVAAWVTVISGTYVVYPWYRAVAPKGADLTQYPKSFLVADPNLANWHNFGMEWKEHVAWLAPLLATVVAYLVWKYAARLSTEAGLRRIVMVTLTIAFVTAAVAGLLGALITKTAPIH